MLQPLSTAIETVAGASVRTIGQPPQAALAALLAMIRTVAAADFAAVLLRTGSVTAEPIACDPPGLLPAGIIPPALIDAALAGGEPWFGRAAGTSIPAHLRGSHAVLPLGQDVAAVIGRRRDVGFDAGERTFLSLVRSQLAPTVQWELAERSREQQSLRFDRQQEAYEAAIGKSAEKYRLLFENAGDGFVLVDDSGRCLDVSASYAALMGRTREEIIGRCVPELTTGITPEFQAEMAQQMAHTGKAVFAGQLQHKDGSFLDVEISVVSLPEGQRLGTVRDITQRKRAAEALRQSEERFYRLFHSSPAGIAVSRLDDGRFVDVNQAYADFTGCSIDEMIGRTSFELGLISSGSHTALLRRRQGDSLKQIELKITGRSGATRTGLFAVDVVDLPGGPYLQSVCVDITERKQAQEQLRESEEKWRSIFNLLPVGISVVDNRRHVTDTNPALSRILQLSQDEILSGAHTRRHYWRADHTPMPPEEFPSALVLKTRMAVQNVEIGIEKEDGAIIWTSVSAAPLNGAASTVTVTVDITELKQAQEQLHLNQARLRAVIENTGDRIWSVDRHYRLLVANSLYSRGIEGLIGHPPPVGGSVLDGFPAPARAFWQSIYDRALAGEPFTFQVPSAVRPGGTLECNLYPIRDAEGTVTGVAGRTTDITERLLAEAALRASEERFRTIFLQAPLGIALIDSLTAGIYAVNPRFAAIAGRTVEEMTATDWSQITHPDDVQRDRDNVAAMNAGLTDGFQMDKRYLRPDGTVVWISMTIARLHGADDGHSRHLCMIEDITERIHAQEQTQRALNQLQLATNAAQIGIWEWDFASDKLTWDDRMCAFYEVPAATRQSGLSYAFWRSRVHPDDLEETESTLRAARSSRELWVHTFRIVLPDGSIRHTHAAATIECDRSGSMVRMVGVNLDITPQRTYEQYLYNANAVLEQQVVERTAELSLALAELKRASQLKDEFMAAVSHELRTPLTGIMSLSEALETQDIGSLSPRQVTYVQMIHDSGERLLRLVNGILRYTSLMGGRIQVQQESCPLAGLCDLAVRALSDQARKKQQSIELSIDPVDLAIISDSDGIVQVLQQLLDNAVKFTPDGGRIGLDVRRDDLAHCVDLAVWDTGIGMSAEQQETIFLPFVQADATLSRRYEGAGLGLAYVRGMVDLLGGTVAVQSRPGAGSRFTVTLPLARKDRLNLDS